MNILLIEDDLRVADLIKRGLEEQEFNVIVAYDGEIGRKLALSNEYDLIITDIILPKINGIDLCKEIRFAKPDTPIIMLTALGTTDDKVEGFDAGANDYLVKPFDFRELQVRVRALLYRTVNSSPSINTLEYADIEMNLETKTVIREGQEIRLTPKEFNLLKYMLVNKERVLTRAEIAEHVWDTHFDTGTNFIDVYMSYLRNKIDKNFSGRLIHTKIGMGFILKKESQRSI